MDQVLYALAVLACPVGMGMLMWLMMRSDKKPSRDAATAASASASDAEMAQLRAEVDRLRAVQPSASISVGKYATR